MGRRVSPESLRQRVRTEAGAEVGDSRADLQSAQQSWRCDSAESKWQVLTAGAEAGDSRADLQSAQQSWRPESVPASEWQVLAAENGGDSEQNIVHCCVSFIAAARGLSSVTLLQ